MNRTIGTPVKIQQVMCYLIELRTLESKCRLRDREHCSDLALMANASVKGMRASITRSV
jgi:hypothetical protein